MPTLPQPVSDQTPVSSSRRWLVWTVVAGAVIIIGGLVYLWLQRDTATTTNTTTEELINTAPSDLPDTFFQAPDQDRDRLTDNQEGELKTNPAKADTDDDQLNDYDEAAIYKTDPLNPDTDGDGFSDGYEVNNGFNPTGAGELLNINGATPTAE